MIKCLLKILDLFGFVFVLSLVIYPIGASAVSVNSGCDIGLVSSLFSLNLDSYEKTISESTEDSVEGAGAEYYYKGNKLIAVKSIYYGETGKTTIDYYFRTESEYAAIVTEFFYSAPIYVQGSTVATTNASKFTVCNNKLVRGIGDDSVVAQSVIVLERLKKILIDAPKSKNN